jgi:hypothetical protein
MADAEFTAFINPAYDVADRRDIALAIISFIKDRTAEGKGVGGKSFGSYAKNYVRHVDFEIAGKSPGKVDLNLTGEMLGSIQILDITIAGRVVIGILEGAEADKAQWMAEKGYDFLGVSEDELELILSDFEEPSANLNEILRIFQVG